MSNTESAAVEVLNHVVLESLDHNGHGTMTACLYDTAWVSCVRKPNEDAWLFPQCFDYLLHHQKDDGSWPIHAGQVSDVDADSILTTTAAIFALQEHTQKGDSGTDELTRRVGLAVDWLERALSSFRGTEGSGVGFEVLFPAHLDLIEARGALLSFPNKAVLSKRRDEKLRKFKPEMLYHQASSTLLHSLEAFYGDERLDFSKLAHHKVQGSMMASPSATAAYLMRSSVWDQDAEEYLQRVFDHGSGKGDGGMPSAYPTTIFEVTWAASTLFAAGLPPSTYDTNASEKLLGLAGQEPSADKHVVGFCPGVQPDLDDSAKASITSSFLGQQGLADQIVARFAAVDHMKTYDAERNASFSANCNALSALIFDTSRGKEAAAWIPRLVDFICNMWWKCSGSIDDKWNLSPLYSMLLMTQALMKMVRHWRDSDGSDIPESALHEKASLTLVQGAIRIMSAQNQDGSWGKIGPREETAYAVLSLSELLDLPILEPLVPKIGVAIEHGQSFLRATEGTHAPEYLWIEKVAYGSSTLSHAYTTAALLAASRVTPPATPVPESTESKQSGSEKLLKLLRSVPLFSKCPDWLLVASMIEAHLFVPQLRRLRQSVFPRDAMTEDKYFDMIPVMWTAVNNLDATYLSSETLFHMMTLSFLNYQADEYVESVVGVKCSEHLEEVKTAIHAIFDICRKPESNTPASNDHVRPYSEENHRPRRMRKLNSSSTAAAPVAEVMIVLEDYVDAVLYHERVIHAPTASRSLLIDELEIFLLAHLTQVEDNVRFTADLSSSGAGGSSASTMPIYKSARQRYSAWVRTTSAQHTSCPFSLAFFACLCGDIGDNARPLWASLLESHIMGDVGRHLASLCRMYNDYGSIARDCAEGNLNSVNFPEFGVSAPDGDAAVDGERRKLMLWGLAQYERRALEHALGELRATAKPEAMRALDVFVKVTDLFGQVYVVKDIASRKLS